MSERMWRRGGVVACVVLGGLLWASGASAQEGAGPKTDDQLVPDLQISLGVKGGLNGSWTTEIPENDPNSPVGDPDYFPLFGLGGSFGGRLQALTTNKIAWPTPRLMPNHLRITSAAFNGLEF